MIFVRQRNLIKDSKTRNDKEKTDKLVFIKIQNFGTSKKQHPKTEKIGQILEKIFPCIYSIRDLYQENTKNFYNSKF